MNSEEVLRAFRESKAFLNGHFELRSGLHSDQFFQCAMVLRYPRVAERLCRALSDKVRAGLGAATKVDCVIGPAMGGIVVGHEIARNLDARSIFAEKEDGKLVLRRGFQVKEGENFVVGEDVVTRGGRVQESIDIIEQRGGNVVAVALLVNRSGGKASFSCPVFSLLAMEPVAYEPDDCPLCKKGMPIEHPGS